MKHIVILIFTIVLNTNLIISQTEKLPEPQMTGGMPLMDALKTRHSIREFSDKKLDRQTLSNILWAAFGVNRRESGKRTAPTAMDERAMELYVILEQGTYLYDAVENSLILIKDKDLRALAGTQPFVASAPLNIAYVADYSKMKTAGETKEVYAGAHTGFIAQNVYLFCSSEGLGSVVRAYFEEEKLKAALNLDDSKNIVLVHTIGYPKE